MFLASVLCQREELLDCRLVVSFCVLRPPTTLFWYCFCLIAKPVGCANAALLLHLSSCGAFLLLVDTSSTLLVLFRNVGFYCVRCTLLRKLQPFLLGMCCSVPPLALCANRSVGRAPGVIINLGLALTVWMTRSGAEGNYEYGMPFGGYAKTLLVYCCSLAVFPEKEPIISSFTFDTIEPSRRWY